MTRTAATPCWRASTLRWSGSATRLPGFGVSLIKAGLRLGGLPVGPVRPPLVDPTEEQLVQLKSILAKGYELAGR